MGLNILLQNVHREDHPDWEWVRHRGDYAFMDLLRALPHDLAPWDQFREAFRPTDEALAELDEAILTDTTLQTEAEAPERYHQFATLLRTDMQKEWWVDTSD